jgi:hypothetical protein
VKVLVATARTQGERDDDYDWCIDGELVWIQEPCGRDRRRDPDSCGCGRGFAGLASHRATTTAVVSTIEGMTRDEYVATMRMGMQDGGWPGELAEEVADELLEFAARWDEGAVLERDLDLFGQRLPV